MKGRKERKNKYSKLNGGDLYDEDEEDLYAVTINCKAK